MGNKQKKQDLLDIAMDIRFTSRTLEKQSIKLEQGEKNELKKIKDVRTPHSKFLKHFLKTLNLYCKR